MRTYRAVWSIVVAVTTALAVAIGCRTVGWLAMAGVAVMLAVFGAIMGLGWVDERRRWGVARAGAGWCVLAGVDVLGLAPFARQWTLLVVVVLAAGHPALVHRGLALVRERRPVGRGTTGLRRVADRDLERRWARTAVELRHPAVTPESAVRLVAERERLLDEIERRDPQRFRAQLVRAGWPTPDSFVD